MGAFKWVCWSFKTFICSSCATAHNSLLHHCIEVTDWTGTWNEVRQWEDNNGGGNKAAYNRWIAGAPDNARPHDKSSQEAIKHFIDKSKKPGRPLRQY